MCECMCCMRVCDCMCVFHLLLLPSGAFLKQMLFFSKGLSRSGLQTPMGYTHHSLGHTHHCFRQIHSSTLPTAPHWLTET